MSYSSTPGERQADPSETLREFRDAYLESFAEFMSSVVNTADYAEATGDVLNTYLNMAEPARIWMDKVMPQILAFYRIPSRQEVASTAERITNLELKLDDISTMLEEIRRRLPTTET